MTTVPGQLSTLHSINEGRRKRGRTANYQFPIPHYLFPTGQLSTVY
ncbi:MAG: hypothetical protein ACRC62_38425 [Microcoleus sp.]